MKTLPLLLLLALNLNSFADLRVHRIDKLGADSPSSPFFDHTEAREEATRVFPEIAKQNGWDFSQSSDSERFTDAGLREIDVLIFDNNTGILFNASEKIALEKWVHAGGGVVGIHGAVHAHKGIGDNNQAEWPFWYGLWGVLHKTGPKEGPNGRRGYADWIVMEVESDSLPIRWQFDKVEWYVWNYHPYFHESTILAIAEVQTNQPELPAYYPVSWRKPCQGGRVWYTNMGHYPENFHQSEFVQHLIEGVNWVAKQ